jgi:Dihydrouridine synthase (Dus)
MTRGSSNSVVESFLNNIKKEHHERQTTNQTKKRKKHHDDDDDDMKHQHAPNNKIDEPIGKTKMKKKRKRAKVVNEEEEEEKQPQERDHEREQPRPSKHRHHHHRHHQEKEQQQQHHDDDATECDETTGNGEDKNGDVAILNMQHSIVKRRKKKSHTNNDEESSNRKSSSNNNNNNKLVPVPFDHRYIVAPMVGASELAFRLLCRKYGAQLAYTPMMSAHEFAYNEQYRRDHNEFLVVAQHPPSNKQHVLLDRPLVCHFSANTPQDFAAAARAARPYCDAIDLNLGW